MDRKELTSALCVGEVFQNPRKGTSTITAITDSHIVYIRGGSPIRLPIAAFLSAIKDFSGKRCSSNDLRSYLPEVFDTHNKNGRKGHDCNCTFLFLVVEKLGLINGGIQGNGASGNPFYVVFK